MKVLILTQGSRGSVQPYVALARSLDAAGHEAVLCAPAESASLAEPYGVRAVPFDDVARMLMTDPELREMVMAPGAGLRRLKRAVQIVRKSPLFTAGMLNAIAAAGNDGADIVVHRPGVPGHELAERLGVPAVLACLQPQWVPTSSFPHPRVSVRLPRALNHASYTFAKALNLPTKIMLRAFRGDPITKWRRETLGLPPRRGHHNYLRRADGTRATVLQAFSRHILPEPLEYPDWVHTVGFWFLPAPPDWTPPQELSDFLAAGDPPVYIGFGSMVGTDSQRTGRIIAEAIRLARVRAVVATGWGGIPSEELGKDVLILDQVPHDWLFPRMTAIVHHGGAGTTAAALASGRPQVVCPFIADQPFYARRVHASGVAPPPQPQRKLTPEGLAQAIRRAITDRALATRAEGLAHLIRAEDSMTTSVKILESQT